MNIELIPCSNHNVHLPHNWRHPDSRIVECMGVGQEMVDIVLDRP